MTTKLLLPILNKNTTLFKGPTWYLSADVSIETISAEDFGMILSSTMKEYQDLISSKSKCIQITNVDPNRSIEIAKIESSIITFLLNCFKQSQPIALSFAVQITRKRKSRIEQIIDLSFISDARLQRKHNYLIRQNVQRETISDFYRVISKVYEKHPSILLTLDRFNSAMFRTNHYDKIIDITISLESLISGTSELKNKFSLYNAWAAETDPAKRRDYFNLLKILYDARSNIVHGSGISPKRHTKIIEPILKRWQDVIELSEKALIYYILYIYSNTIDRWYQHQENMALGIDERAL